MNCKSMAILQVSVLTLTRKCNLQLVDTQEICQLESFSQSLHATQSFIEYCTIDIDNDELFYIRQI